MKTVWIRFVQLISIWNQDYLRAQESQEGYTSSFTLIPNFHKHLLLQTLQRMNIGVMEVVLEEELCIAHLAFAHKQTLIERRHLINLE